MRPNLATARHLAKTLGATLVGHRIDRVWRPEPDMLLFDVGTLFDEGPRVRLLVDVEPRHPRVILTERWPETPKAPDRETLFFRNHVENRKIISVEIDGERRLILRLAPLDTALVIQLAGRYPNIAVQGADGTIEARLFADRPPSDPDSPPLPVGDLFRPDLADANPSWHAALAAASWGAWDTRRFDERRNELLRRVRSHRERQQRTANRLEEQLAAADKAETLRRHGELLKTVMRDVPPGASEVTATDWYVDPPGTLAIPLDPKLSAIANLDKIFNRYRKLLRTRDEAEERLVPLWDELQRLSDLESAIASANTMAALELASDDARTAGIRGKQAAASPRDGARDEGPRLPYRRFQAADGTEIWLGRSARDNDVMTFRHARGHDLFLHAHDVAGSHVILRAATRGVTPSADALLDAATLAAFHSKARDEGIVTVLYTERKHVRKGKGLAPGRVTVAATRTIAVRIEQARIDRLYADQEA